MLMAYEATRDFQLAETTVTTPITETTTYVLAGKKVAVIPILRAGLGMVDGILELIPAAKVGPHRPVPRPRDAPAGRVLLQAARGHRRARRAHRRPDARHGRLGVRRRAVPARSAARASIKLLVPDRGARGHRARSFDDVRGRAASTSCAVDSHLNDHGYIVPGLGDAGDRLFGTK